MVETGRDGAPLCPKLDLKMFWTFAVRIFVPSDLVSVWLRNSEVGEAGAQGDLEERADLGAQGDLRHKKHENIRKLWRSRNAGGPGNTGST